MQLLAIYSVFLKALPLTEEIHDTYEYVILLFLKEHSKWLQRRLQSWMSIWIVAGNDYKKSSTQIRAKIVVNKIVLSMISLAPVYTLLQNQGEISWKFAMWM